MSEEPVDDAPPPAWEWREHALIVLPGLSWNEWTSLWSTVERIHKSSSFYTGDALNYGLQMFGEQFSEVVDEKYIHQQHGPMWVCSKIPPSRRRPNLSYSLHRETAALDEADQIRWLDRAEADRWTVKELKEAMAEERARQPGTNGGPHIHEPPADPEDDPPLPLDDDPPEFRPEVPQSTLVKRAPPADEAETSGAGYTASEIRQLIAGTREVDAALVNGGAQQDRLVELSDGIAHALGCPAAPKDRLALINEREALRLIPRGWRRSLTHDGTDEGMWMVELRRGDSFAVGAAAHLPVAICEAALSSLLSESEP